MRPAWQNEEQNVYRRCIIPEKSEVPFVFVEALHFLGTLYFSPRRQDDRAELRAEVVNCLGEESALLQLKGESSLPEEG